MKKTTTKKIKDIILGLLLICAAVLLILRSTDVALPLIAGISLFKLAGAVIVLTFIIFRLIDGKFSFILQALTILYGIFIEEIAHIAGIKESSLFFICQTFRLRGEVFLPDTVGADVLFVTVDVTVNDVVTIRAAKVGTEGEC